MDVLQKINQITSGELSKYVGGIKSISSLKALFGNEVYHITGEESDVIVKLSDSLIRGNNIENEYKTINKLEQLNVDIPIPKAYCFIKKGNTLMFLEDYINASSLRDIFFQMNNSNRIKVIQETAYMLKKIHNVQIQTAEPSTVLDVLLEVAEENMNRCMIDLSEFTGIETPEQVLGWLKENKPLKIETCLLHGDFRPKNILWDGEKIVGIIDWEHSFIGDLYYDLAVLFYYLSDEEQVVFTKCYGIADFDQSKLAYYDNLSKFLNI